MDGVLIVFATLMTSLSLGTPNVTFLEATPAKWKVLRVICVAGSPMLCAPMLPAISPGCARLRSNRDWIAPSSQSKDSLVSRSRWITCLAERTDLR